MKSISYKLESMKPGMFMCWNITAQACFDFAVTLRDDKTTYGTWKKAYSQNGDLCTVGNGDSVILGENLRFEISSDRASALDSSATSGVIADKQGRTLGHVTDLCFEDNGGSIDYNDLFINIVAWKYRG